MEDDPSIHGLPTGGGASVGNNRAGEAMDLEPTPRQPSSPVRDAMPTIPPAPPQLQAGSSIEPPGQDGLSTCASASTAGTITAANVVALPSLASTMLPSTAPANVVALPSLALTMPPSAAPSTTAVELFPESCNRTLTEPGAAISSADDMFKKLAGLNLYTPPNVDWSSTDPKYYNGIDWLSSDMRREVMLLRPLDGQDIDESGNLNKERLARAAGQIFTAKRLFRNKIQLAQMAQLFASTWGFVSTIAGKWCRCNCAESNTAPHISVVSPNSKRESGPSPKDVKCGYGIGSTAPAKYKVDIGTPNAAHPVSISKTSFLHACSPGKMQQLRCIKTSGKYSNLYGDRLVEIALMLKDVHIPCTSLRQLLRPHLPAEIPLSATDVHNFRVRCFLLCNQEDTGPDDIEKLTEGVINQRDLDFAERETLLSDTVLSKAKDLLKKSMNSPAEVDGNGNEKLPVLHYLDVLKNNSDDFDYRVRKEGGQIVAIVWMTKQMRRDWIMYGDVVCLDAQKKHINRYRWPYVGPVVMDNENRIAVVAEALVIGETFEMYNFVMRSLEEMEPRRPLCSVNAVFGDGFFNQDMMGRMGMVNAELFWDHFHLLTSIWPPKLGTAAAGKVEVELNALVKSTSEDAFRVTAEAIRQALGPESNAVQYLETNYFNCPERFAKYAIDRIECTMGRVGSSASESNHSSISAFFNGGGMIMDVQNQVCSLLSRQHERCSTRAFNDSVHKASLATSEDDSLAHHTLSAYVYETYWQPILEDANNYTLIGSDSEGRHMVHRRGRPLSTARAIPNGGRCSCTTRISCGVQCAHEVVVNQGHFMKALFHPRHYRTDLQDLSLFTQLPASPRRQPAGLDANGNAVETDDGFGDIGDDGGVGFTEGEDNKDDNSDDDDDDDSDNNRCLATLARTGGEVAAQSQASGHPSEPTPVAPVATRRIDYGVLKGLFDRAWTGTGGKQRLLQLVATVLESTAVLLTGDNQAQVDNSCTKAVAALRGLGEIKTGACSRRQKPAQAKSAAAPSSGRTEKLRKKVGPKKSKKRTHDGDGAVRNVKKSKTCSFCQGTGHIKPGCTKYQKYGVKLTNPQGILRCLENDKDRLYPQVLLPLDEDTPQRPALEALPQATKWLCVHKKCYRNSGGESENTVFVIVSCLGESGDPLGPAYSNRSAMISAISTWFTVNKSQYVIMDEVKLNQRHYP